MDLNATGRDRPDIIALPPLIALAALAVSLLLEWALPLGLLPPPLRFWPTLIGIVVATSALSFAASAIMAFKRAGTNIDPREPALALVEGGPYRITRNPMYVGLILLLLGIALIASLDWALPMAVALWAALHHGVVLREEAYLIEKFGEPYRAYLARSRRWLW